MLSPLLNQISSLKTSPVQLTQE
jgi:hypothetical protein